MVPDYGWLSGNGSMCNAFVSLWVPEHCLSFHLKLRNTVDMVEYDEHNLVEVWDCSHLLPHPFSLLILLQFLQLYNHEPPLMIPSENGSTPVQTPVYEYTAPND